MLRKEKEQEKKGPLVTLFVAAHSLGYMRLKLRDRGCSGVKKLDPTPRI